MKILLLAVTFILILIAQQNLIKADFIHDDVNVIGNVAEIDNIIHDLYNKYDIIISVDTVEETDNIQELARKRFFERGLDKSGTKELNLLVLYSKNTNELTIGHADKCSLESGTIFSVLKDERVTGEIENENYNGGLLNAVRSLKDKLIEKVTNWFCDAPPKLEFTVDQAIYEPRTPDNPYGKALNRELNPYDDDIVTVYDPLICKLSNADNLKEVEFTIQISQRTITKKAKCEDEKCIVYISPLIGGRGREIKCSVTINGKELSDELVISKYILIFFPYKQDNLGNAKDEYDFFLSISEANKFEKAESGAIISERIENSIKPIYIKEGVYKFYFWQDVAKGVGFYVFENIYRGDLNYDRYVLVSDNFALRGGFTSPDRSFIAISGIGKTILAHELGHSISDLCDEWKKAPWEAQNSKQMGGCPNPFPECCNIPYGEEQSCFLESGVCAGMPYENDKITPAPQKGLFANYYSIMGGSKGIQILDKNPIYPIQATCPLRNC